MARREIFVDDITGKEGDTVQTRRYSIGHQAYTIDLSDESYEKFLKDLEKYTSVSSKAVATGAPRPARGVRAARGTGSTPARTVTQKGNTAQEVREWLRANDFGHLAQSDRGRLSREAIERWNEASEHSDNQYTGA